MIFIKPGVVLKGIQPETVLGINLCEGIFNYLGQKFTITSVMEGKHKVGSLHYKGFAFDVRIHDLLRVDAACFAQMLRERLPPEFQVILEVDHIHVEFDSHV